MKQLYIIVLIEVCCYLFDVPTKLNCSKFRNSIACIEHIHNNSTNIEHIHNNSLPKVK